MVCNFINLIKCAKEIVRKFYRNIAILSDLCCFFRCLQFEFDSHSLGWKNQARSQTGCSGGACAPTLNGTRFCSISLMFLLRKAGSELNTKCAAGKFFEFINAVTLRNDLSLSSYRAYFRANKLKVLNAPQAKFLSSEKHWLLNFSLNHWHFLDRTGNSARKKHQFF